MLVQWTAEICLFYISKLFLGYRCILHYYIMTGWNKIIVRNVHTYNSGGGGACLIGACTSSASITFWKATVPTALWTLHVAWEPGNRSQISYTLPWIFHGPVQGIFDFDTFFFFLFSIPLINAIRALRSGWWKDSYPFYAFLLTRMMYRPQWDNPPPRIQFGYKVPCFLLCILVGS